MYLFTEWEGRTAKYLARGQDVRTESQIFSRSARPGNQIFAKFLKSFTCTNKKSSCKKLQQ